MTLVRGDEAPTLVGVAGAPSRHRRPPVQATVQLDAGTWWTAAAGAAIGFVLFLVARQAMPDDSLIHASYARNLLERGEWALTPGVPANTATSPLWVWLLAAGGAAFGSVVAAGAFLLSTCLAAFAVAVRRLGGTGAAVLATVVVATAPVMTSAVGMEAFLAAALLVWLVERVFADSFVAATVLTAAMVLTRPDLAAAAVVIVVAGAWALHQGRLLTVLPIGGLLSAPWFLVSWVAFGSAWPDTVPLKSAMPGWGDGSVHLWNAAPYYFATWPAATLLTVAVVLVGAAAVPVAVERRAWSVVALAAGGMADLVFVASTAGPPASYYAAPAVCALGVAAVLVGVRGHVGWVPIAGTALVAVAFAVQFAGWSSGFAPLRTNWATDAQYARIADELPRDGIVLSHGEIGALAFFCIDHGCRVVDDLLADPHATDRYVDRWRAEHPWAAVNYRFRDAAPALPIRYELDYGDGPKPGTTPVGVWPVTGADGGQRVAVLTRTPRWSDGPTGLRSTP